MGRIIGAALVAALAVFLWGAVSWLLLPWHTSTLHNIPEGDAVVELLKAKLPKSGVYHYPGLPESDDPAAKQAMMDKAQRGPVVPFLYYRAEGVDPMPVSAFIGGFAISFACAAILASLLCAATSAGAFPSFEGRLLFVAAIGIFTALVAQGEQINWGQLPLNYGLAMAADVVIGWTLAGLVLAAWIKKR